MTHAPCGFKSVRGKAQPLEDSGQGGGWQLGKPNSWCGWAGVLVAEKENDSSSCWSHTQYLRLVGPFLGRTCTKNYMSRTMSPLRPFKMSSIVRVQSSHQNWGNPFNLNIVRWSWKSFHPGPLWHWPLPTFLCISFCVLWQLKYFTVCTVGVAESESFGRLTLPPPDDVKMPCLGSRDSPHGPPPPRPASLPPPAYAPRAAFTVIIQYGDSVTFIGGGGGV